MPRERILVVANSRKSGGRCIAGISLPSARFVRPVSPRGDGALADSECEAGGRIPRLLDVVCFEHVGCGNDPAQPENVVIAARPWTRERRANRDQALELLRRKAHRGATIFVNDGRAIAEPIAAKGLERSLMVIEPRRLRFGRGAEADAREDSPRALFIHAGRPWNLPITDFELRPRILRAVPGIHEWADLGLRTPRRVVLALSLGALYEGWHHKLVAAVLRFW